jgi:CubicO group peptidase (beta-lactamase class C family)
MHFTPVSGRAQLAGRSHAAVADGRCRTRRRRPTPASRRRSTGASSKPITTRAPIVVVHRGKIVSERYAPGWTKDTPQISWSAGKSITAALVGIIVQRGSEGGRRGADQGMATSKEIRAADRVRDLLRMSSGLDFANLGLNGRRFVHARQQAHADLFRRPQRASSTPSTSRRKSSPTRSTGYRNSDPLTLGRIVKEAVEAKGETYLTFPQRALFDKIGARNFVLETGCVGQLHHDRLRLRIGEGLGALRLLHLWKGKWNGEQILPADWLEFISTPAPADKAKRLRRIVVAQSRRPVEGRAGDAIRASGHMGQYTMVIPSRDAVIVRLGPKSARLRRLFTSWSPACSRAAQ